jgi:hypothetical protein
MCLLCTMRATIRWSLGSDGMGGHPDSSTSSQNGIPYRNNTVRGWRAEPVLAARQINKSTTRFRMASVVWGGSNASS